MRFRLIALVLIASLPALALLFLTASQQRSDALDAGQEEADRIAQTASSDQSREVDRAQRELSLLGRLPEVNESSGTNCTSLFTALVSDPDIPFYADLRVLNKDGTIFCQSSTDDPFGVNIKEPFVQRALAGENFTVGGYQIQQSNARTVVRFASPVLDSRGEVFRVIVASLPLGQNSSVTADSALPEGAIISIVSEKGTLLSQQPPDEQATIGASLQGTPVIDSMMLGTPEVEPNRLFAADRSGGYVTAMSPIRPSGNITVDEQAYVVVQLPEAGIVRNADNAFRDNLGKLGVAAAIVVFAAWVSADFFVSRDTETRKSLVAELYHAYSSGAVEHLESIVADNFVDHSPSPNQAKGIDGLLQNITAFRTAFPDGEIVPREMISGRDKVVARVSLTGTQLADYNGIPASGKRMIADGTEIFQFQQGVISEGWSLMGPLVELKKLAEAERETVIRKPKRRLWQKLFRRGKKS